MIHSHQQHAQRRVAITAREMLALHQRSTIGALLLVLIVTAFCAGSSSVFAQNAKGTVAPTVAKVQNTAPISEKQPTAGVAATKVNINTADAHTLAANLKGVGEARALEIVRHRETYGPFASADELTEVKGIGPSTLEMNRDSITLE